MHFIATALAFRRSARRLVVKALVSVVVAAGGIGGLGWAAEPFAALTVTPFGDQVFDITTGVTTLPDGGTIVDHDTGVSLQAAFIEYRSGDYVQAQDVDLDGAFGAVHASNLTIDLVAGQLSATGDLSLRREGLAVVAGSLDYYAAAQVAVFAGGVAASAPKFSAQRVLLDVVSGNVLLDGEYLYEGGFFAMQSPEGGGTLALVLVVSEGIASYDAATEPAPELLARLAPYL